jgi:hypothetical protein
MAQLDLAIHGITIVTASDEFRADLGIRSGRKRSCLSAVARDPVGRVVPGVVPLNQIHAGDRARVGVSHMGCVRGPVEGLSVAAIADSGTEQESTAPLMSAVGVRRDKAALSSGCESHPANAPAGSNRSSHGGNEVAEAFD